MGSVLPITRLIRPYEIISYSIEITFQKDDGTISVISAQDISSLEYVNSSIREMISKNMKSCWQITNINIERVK